MKTHITKRVIALLLTLAMVLSLLPMTFAAEPAADEYVLATALKDGDKVVIVNPDVNKAVSNADLSEQYTQYRAGVDVTPADGKLTAPDAAIIWTVETTEKGVLLKDAEGHKLSMENSGLELDKTNDVWEVRPLEEGTVALVNVNAKAGSSGDPKALEWYKKYSEFSTHYLTTTDPQFIHQLYVLEAEEAPEAIKVETTFPSATKADIDKYGDVHFSISSADLAAAGFEYKDLVKLSFLDQELIVPVIPQYRYVGAKAVGLVMWEDGAKPAEVEVFNGSFAATYGLADVVRNGSDYTVTPREGVEFPVPVTIEMYEKQGYADTYAIFDLTRSNNREDYRGNTEPYPNLSDEEFANFRVVDTTGMGEKTLYRASSPVNPSIGRNTYADAAAEAAGVKSFVNLADSAESAAKYAGYADSYYSKQNICFLNLGVDFTTELNKAGMVEAMSFLKDCPTPVLVHCNEGQDRAGFVSAMLECLMGAGYDEVVADYMTTFYNYYGVQKDTDQYNQIANNIIKNLSTAFGLKMEELADADLAAKAEAYFLELGVSAETIAAVKENLGGKNNTGELAGKTVILHTNDTHGALLGFAQVAKVKADLEAQGAKVLLVDAGDYSQGNPYVSLSKGETAITVMNAAGYDYATLGNHEFDYGWPQLKANLAKATFQPIVADVIDEATGKSVYDGHVIKEVDGVKIGFFGMETPEASTKANPALMVGLKFPQAEEMYAIAQAEIDALKAEGADLVICLAHLGVDAESEPNRSVDLYKNVTGIDFLIDGHSHTVMTEGPEGEPIQSTGTKDGDTALMNVGYIQIDNETKKIEDNKLIPLGKEAPADPAVATVAREIMDAVDAEYNVVFARSEVELNGDRAPGNRNEETNLGDLITDAMLWSVVKTGGLTVDTDHVVAITNGGGIRAWIHAGDVTKKDVNTVLPFGNTVAVVYVTGTELLEALEASTYCTPTAVGGFPQVAGMKFSITTPVEFDEGEFYPGSTYHKPASIRRVTIHNVNGKDFDPEATYAVVTNNFCAAGGDTYYAFKAASKQFDTGIPLDEALMDYIHEELNDVIGEDYAEPQGRIAYRFDDVTDPDAYYYDAVYWAVSHDPQITNGTSDLSFTPDRDCTRAEVVTFLWRAYGKEAPASTANPFSDVEADTWYTDAVLWAANHDPLITNGIGDGKFGVTVTCTRAEVVTFLWRAAGSPAPKSSENPFNDVEANSWYTDAVLWAVEQGITNGTGEGGFSPTAVCSRGQIVTFLYRAISKQENAICFPSTSNDDIAKYGNIYTNKDGADFFAEGYTWGDIVTVKFLDKELDLPIVPTFSYVDSGTPGVFVNKDSETGEPTGRLFMAINMGNFAEFYGLAAKTTNEDKTYFWTPMEGVEFPVPVEITMKEQGGYATEMAIRDINRTNNREDYPELSDAEFANFRQITTTGMGDHLYRGSSPINPEIGRNTYADAELEKAGVTVVMNLANSQAEAEAYPGFSDSYYSKQNIVYLNLGVDFFADEFKAGLANGLKHFASNPGVYYVHCTEGKDRAGFVSALLECFMGATCDEVVADYLKTYTNYYTVVDGKQQPLSQETLDAIAESNIIKSLQRAFGVEDLKTADLAAKAEAYIKGLGLTDEEVANLKTNLGGKAPVNTEFEFLVTSDLHGQIYATDYTQPYEQSGTYSRGLTRVATYIKEQRENYGDNLYVVDMGDTFQGAPLTYYYAFNKPEEKDPAILAFRSIGYDMWVVGNHEFNYGLQILTRQMDYAVSAGDENEKQLTISMANYLKAETNNDETKDWATWRDVAPYVIKDFGGYKVAIIGFGNPNVPKWDVPANWEGIYFANIIETYKHYEADMLEQADMIVVVAHSGTDSDPGSDFIKQLVEETDTIAFAFSGHEHKDTITKVKNLDGKEISILSPYTKARRIAQVKVTVNGDEVTMEPELKNMENYTTDESLAELLKPYETDTWENYMLQEIGKALGDYPAANLGTAPSAFVDLINTVQIWGGYDRSGENTPDKTEDDTPAMLSITAPLTSGSNANLIPQGPIYLGDMFGLYRFENWFYQITMSGEEVHQWLEFAATKIKVDGDGNPYVTNGDLTYYDIITGDGFRYDIDVSKPEGERVVNMTYNDQKVAADQEFTVMVNNYRYNGGGNYVSWLNDHGCEFEANDPDRIIYSTQFDMIQGEDEGQARALLVSYIKEQTAKNGGITPTITSTWTVQNGIEEEPTGPSFIKITEAPGDWTEGTYLLVYEADAENGKVFNGADGANGASYDAVTIANGVIDYDEALFTVSFETMEGGYAIHTKNGYMGNVTTGNGVTSSSETQVLNTLSLEEDGILLISNSRYFRFNPNNNNDRFRYFNMNNTNGNYPLPAIYVLVNDN